MLLAVNCGSSSIKYKLFGFPELNVLIDGSASNVETKGAKPVIKFVVHENDHNEEESEEEKDGMAYDEVFERIITLLETSSSHHFLKASAPGRARDVVQIIAHRVVHGGAATEPMVIKPNEQEKIDELDKLSAFAPLHNHRAILTIKSCLQHLPNSTQVLLFDTLFHSTIPPYISTYPLAPPAEAPPIPLKKYGAHGLSYASVLSSIATHLGKPESQCNLIVAHLGSGASVCVIKNGKSLDTSMGLTPLDGLPGGTRSGSVDPVLIFHHTPGASEEVEAKGVKLSKGELLLNKQGGLQAVCGTSDFGTIMARISAPGGAEDDRQSAQLAFDLFLDRVLNYLGSYTLKLLGSGSSLDGIVFAGGIGERATQLRESTMGYFKFLGAKPDKEKNEAAGKKGGGTVAEITAQGSYPRFFVCKTDEEFQCAKMARDLIDH